MKGEESMEIGLIFKIAAVGIIVSVILVLMWIVPYIYDLFKTIQILFEL